MAEADPLGDKLAKEVEKFKMDSSSPKPQGSNISASRGIDPNIAKQTAPLPQMPKPENPNDPTSTSSVAKSATQMIDEINEKETQLRSYLNDRFGRLRREEQQLAAFKHELDKIEEPSRVYVEDYRKKITQVDKEIAAAKMRYEQLVEQAAEAKKALDGHLEVKDKLSEKLLRVVKDVETKRNHKLQELHAKMAADAATEEARRSSTASQ